MRIRSLKIPALVIALGLVAAIAACLVTCIVRTPTVTEHDFPYAATYAIDGETKTLDGVYRCRFVSVGEGTSPLERYYAGEYLTDIPDADSAIHPIARQGDRDLCIVFIFTDSYLMGDGIPADADSVTEPYLAVFDKEGCEYADAESIGAFGAELLSWEIPQPIDNSFVFSGFCGPHDVSMLAMLLVGLLVIAACIIFVKKDRDIAYKALDKVSAVMNLAVGIVVIPLSTLSAWLMQIYVSGDEFLYRANLCVPAVTAFAIAASVALRRKGFARSAFFVQLVGPALFVLLVFLESVL